MKTDRELLELAAKAAGININQKKQRERDEAGYGNVGLWTFTTTNWNPLTDDGDALRLSMRLKLDISYNRDTVEVSMSQYDSEEDFRWAWLPYKDDPSAATRRAIVRTASKLGEAMP